MIELIKEVVFKFKHKTLTVNNMNALTVALTEAIERYQESSKVVEPIVKEETNNVEALKPKTAKAIAIVANPIGSLGRGMQDGKETDTDVGVFEVRRNV